MVLMGQLEKSIIKQIRLARVQKAILYTIGAVGLLSSPFAGPMILKELIKSGWKPTKRNPKYTIDSSIKRLLSSDLVVFEKTPKGTFLCLTLAGKARLMGVGNASFRPTKPKRWDNKWRIVIFDIREARRSIRAKLRQTLTVLGFVRLQNSVWVYPYDCEDFITLIKADFKIGKDILYIIADRIENDAPLRKRFDLR